ncbi:MAG TPA: hypothetical protein VJ397_01470 [Thermoplasmata archaeon]|nr:hypothetical protein [Thermoplasmata archaeon]
MRLRGGLRLTLFVLFAVPSIACAVTAAMAAVGGASYGDAFATAALVAFIFLLILAWVAGPVRIDMTMTRSWMIPRAQIRHYTQGRVDLAPLSFPLQVLALAAAAEILVIGLAVSALL